MSEKDKKTVGVFLLVSLFVLIIIAGLVFYATHVSTLLLKTILYVGVAGGIGGVAYGIRGFLYHIENNDFKAKWKWWYLYHPITGFVYGVLAYLLIIGGLLSLNTLSPDYSKGILLYCGISFLAGFASKKFNEKLDELASTVFSTTASTSAAAHAPSFVVSGFQDTVTAGSAGSITVTAKDANGKTASGYTGTVHFTSSDIKSVLPSNYAFQASDAGVHTFTNGVTLETAGSQSINVADSGFSSITGSQSDIKVNAAAASKLAFNAGLGQSLTANVVSPLAIVVQQQDAYDNPVKSGTSPITVGLTTLLDQWQILL